MRRDNEDKSTRKLKAINNLCLHPSLLVIEHGDI